jgi:hypothetical protein
MLLAGCSKSPTGPKITDPYYPMYGTWTGLLMASDNWFAWSVTDSVRLIISATGATPELHLWQLKLESAPGYPPMPNAVWREMPLSETEVVGGLLRIEDWTGTITATSAPDTGIAALGWNRPACKWDGVFMPDAPRSGAVTGFKSLWVWPGLTDSIGQMYLTRQ